MLAALISTKKLFTFNCTVKFWHKVIHSQHLVLYIEAKNRQVHGYLRKILIATIKLSIISSRYVAEHYITVFAGYITAAHPKCDLELSTLLWL